MVELKIGDRAPDFALASTDGGGFSLLAEIAKGPVLLNFYVGDFGINCYNYLTVFTERHSEISGIGVRMVGINPDSLESHLKWKERLGASFEFLFDEGGAVSREYGAIVGPGHMVSGFTNREFFLVGTDGRIRYIWRADKPKTLPEFNEILEGVRNGLNLQF